MGAVQHLLIHCRRAISPALVQWAGYGGSGAIVFTETGLFFGFFLPGDSLLVTAGLLVSRACRSMSTPSRVLLDLAAVAGDNTNYWVGRLSGPRVFRRDESLFFKTPPRRARPRILRSATAPRRSCSRASCRSSGPSPRSSPGVARMDYRTFLTFSVIGGTAWIWSMVLLGYYLGQYVPGVAATSSS